MYEEKIKILKNPNTKGEPLLVSWHISSAFFSLSVCVYVYVSEHVYVPFKVPYNVLNKIGIIPTYCFMT